MLLGAALASLALTSANSNAQTQPPGDFLNGFDNNTSGAANSTASWIYWYNGAGTIGLDTAVKKTGAGSLKVTIPFTLPFRSPDQGVWFGNWDNVGAYDTTIVYDGTYFTNISCDILMDPSDPTNTDGSFGVLGMGLEPAGTPGGARESGTQPIPGIASNTWVTLNQPVHKTDGSYLSSPGVIAVVFTYSTYDNGNQYFLTNPVTMHIDNLHVWLGPVTNPPPPLKLTNITPGLNFVQGSISGQYDRQNIRTLNSPSLNYSWVGAASVGNPVTYSFTVAKWNAPDLTYHIFVTPVAGIGGASAPDYNATNCMIFQIGRDTNGTEVSVFWKTNSPSSGVPNIALAVTNTGPIVGTWQVKFTSDTNGTCIAPDNTQYPFVLDPTLAADLANPAYFTFGILPAADTNTLLGESVVISQMGITGVSSLSAVGPLTSDNFLTDTGLDTTNTWEVNALYPASILFVPTNTAYALTWTLPATGLVPEVNTSLTSPATWNVLQPAISVLYPGKVALIPKSSLPAGSTAFFRLNKLIPTQMQVLLPGETNAPNTFSGKIGSPTPVSGVDSLTAVENVTINVCDANWNIVPLNGDSISITSTDTAASLPGNVAFSNGTAQTSLLFGTVGTWTVTATAASNNYPPATSSSVMANP